jgi:hypothetical protein
MMDKSENYVQFRWCPIDGAVCGENCELCEKTDKEVNYSDGYSKEK